MERLKGKVAIITGAAKGIGAATAKLFADEGCLVIATDILDDVKNQWIQQYPRIQYYHLDVTDESNWEKCFDWAVRQFGHVDILFNNAGIIGDAATFGPQNPEQTSLASWKTIHAINLDSVFLGCKYAIKYMKTHGGSIINMSSRSGLVGIPNASAYSSSKAAIRNYTKTVALYCAQKGYKIRCNSIHPAAIATDIWNAHLGTNKAERESTLQTIIAGIPLGHMGTPLDVAYLVLYLASDESSFMTGSKLVLDGGILAGCASAPSAGIRNQAG